MCECGRMSRLTFLVPKRKAVVLPKVESQEQSKCVVFKCGEKSQKNRK